MALLEALLEQASLRPRRVARSQRVGGLLVDMMVDMVVELRELSLASGQNRPKPGQASR